MEEKKLKFRKRRKKVCLFCFQKRVPDYKDLDTLKRFVTDRGKIMSVRSSACCTKHQRMIAKAIKRARQAGLLFYTAD